MPLKVLGPKGHLVIRSLTPASLARRVPALVKRFGKVTVSAADSSKPNLRQLVVAEAKWGVAHEPEIHYREVRPFPLAKTLPLTTDCSGFATLCYFHAGAPDPNGLHYNGTGYTGTLLDHGALTTTPRPGDLVFYGPGTAYHVAVVVEGGPDPLTVSHGQEGGPQYVRVSQDNRQPVRYRSYL